MVFADITISLHTLHIPGVFPGGNCEVLAYRMSVFWCDAGSPWECTSQPSGTRAASMKSCRTGPATTSRSLWSQTEVASWALVTLAQMAWASQVIKLSANVKERNCFTRKAWLHGCRGEFCHEAEIRLDSCGHPHCVWSPGVCTRPAQV